MKRLNTRKPLSSQMEVAPSQQPAGKQCDALMERAVIRPRIT